MLQLLLTCVTEFPKLLSAAAKRGCRFAKDNWAAQGNVTWAQQDEWIESEEAHQLW